jgi:phosphoenolpyruvate synthase/pyruvate phosphate dikinase
MSLDRRQFLLSTSSVLAGVASVGHATAQASTVANANAFTDWGWVRNQFDLSPEYLHFSQFFIVSHPRPVREAIERLRRAMDANPFVTVEHGQFGTGEGNQSRRVQQAAASYIGGKPEEIALVDSTTEGLALIYHGLPLKPGDEILTTTHDHFAHHESIRLAARKFGSSTRRVPLYAHADAVTADEVTTNLRRAIASQTRVVGLTWVHSGTGVKLPIRQLAAVVSEANLKRSETDRILLVVDGVHGFGNQDETPVELGCNFFAAGTHKWIFAPRGTGIIWARAENWARIQPTIPTMHGVAPYEGWMEDQDPGATQADFVSPGGFKAYEHLWAMPEAFAELSRIASSLEAHYRDMQDVEFTVQEGKLFMLQTRSGKRTAKAALKTAVDMVSEGLITEDEAVLRVDPAAFDQLLHPTLDPSATKELIASGLAASPGAATGEAVFTADEAERAAADGRDVILVRLETSPEDIHGMHAAKGVLTVRGGMTSHAAVVARGMGRPCVTGASALKVDVDRGLMTAGSRTIARGEVITIDGTTGNVYRGRVPMRLPEMTGDFGTLMAWADARRRLKVRANADTPADCETARRFGAEGVGLCRTEHMFFDLKRIIAVREMILADDTAGREAALAKLLPMQRSDFHEIFKIMDGLPVTIRLLDPPLHEFIPHSDEEIAEVAKAAGADPAKLKSRAIALAEANPMLGHRGCRLGITYPEIYEMQARAIMEAALDVEAEIGKRVDLEIMVPLIGFLSELDFLKARIESVAEKIAATRGKRPHYMIGTMIELPRAALMAAEIAKSAEFFSFGTNDLTQTTLGVSRDDAASFLSEYLAKGLIERDPFVSLDRAGVGELVEIAVERGRKSRPKLKLGICGEHGGDPDSIRFCHTAGLDYVSCSPFRVPVARLAAAQAALAKTREKD